MVIRDRHGIDERGDTLKSHRGGLFSAFKDKRLPQRPPRDLVTRRHDRRRLVSDAVVITAFVMLTVQPGRVKPLAERLLDLPGIAEVYSVAGPFDLVAIVRVRLHEELADLVTERIAGLEGIVRTETLTAFRAFSKRDLGLMWDLGE